MEIQQKILELAKVYKDNLDLKVKARIDEMKTDDNRHYALYNALGVSNKEGELIDVYQNKGRFLYKYAGSFIEEAAILCIKEAYADADRVKIPNLLSPRPKQFEIDCLVEDKDAFEIKWRDATTDGDHITKEHTRMKAVANKGYKPIRLMFYEPLRGQAIKIQAKLRQIYVSEGGEYYAGDDAWIFLKNYTQIDVKKMISEIGYTNNV